MCMCELASFLPFWPQLYPDGSRAQCAPLTETFSFNYEANDTFQRQKLPKKKQKPQSLKLNLCAIFKINTLVLWWLVIFMQNSENKNVSSDL